MGNHHPYESNNRVVGDQSRFEYQKHCYNQRATSGVSRVLTKPQQTMPDNSSSRYDDSDYIYSFYLNLESRTPHKEEHAPYPTQGYSSLNASYNELSEPPPPPSKSPNFRHEKPKYMLQNEVGKDKLPPMQDSRDYQANLQSQRDAAEENEISYQNAEAPRTRLLGQIMVCPLFVLGKNEPYGTDQNHYYGYNVTASNVLDFLQLIFGILILILASVLTTKDNTENSGLYRYFIAVGTITLVVALLFLTKSINFEKSHGVLYCLLACILSGVALIISITSIATDNNCATSSICLMRKALSTFAILSFFLWMCNVVMFLTVLYVTKLDSHHEDVFDNRRVQAQGKFNDPMFLNDNDSYHSDTTQVEKMLETSGLPHYFLSSNGQLHTLESHHDISGKNKVVVYM